MTASSLRCTSTTTHVAHTGAFLGWSFGVKPRTRATTAARIRSSVIRPARGGAVLPGSWRPGGATNAGTMAGASRTRCRACGASVACSSTRRTPTRGPPSTCHARAAPVDGSVARAAGGRATSSRGATGTQRKKGGEVIIRLRERVRALEGALADIYAAAGHGARVVVRQPRGVRRDASARRQARREPHARSLPRRAHRHGAQRLRPSLKHESPGACGIPGSRVCCDLPQYAPAS